MFNSDEILEWINEKIDLVFESWNNQLFDLPTAIANSIPVPDFLLTMTPIVIPPSVSYYAQMFEMPFGFQIMVAAFIARFALRRIPFIG
jgi:hypothetical protein